MPTPGPCSALRACARSAPPKARAPREQGGVLCCNIFADPVAAEPLYVKREGRLCSPRSPRAWRLTFIEPYRSLG